MIGAILLLAIGITGFMSALHDFGDVRSIGQGIMNTTQFIYATLSLLMVAGLFFRRRPMRAVAFLWLLSFTFSTGMAPIVWGNTSLIAGLLAGAGAAAAGVPQLWIVLKVRSEPI
jgi:hypothetical protein